MICTSGPDWIARGASAARVAVQAPAIRTQSASKRAAATPAQAELSAAHGRSLVRAAGVACRAVHRRVHRAPGTAGAAALAGRVVTVQFTVLWQLPQSSVVLGCWICLPIALMPLWQLRHGAREPHVAELAAVQAIVP